MVQGIELSPGMVELMSADVARARSFYGLLLGRSYAMVERPSVYEAAAQWRVYFGVAQLQPALERLPELGGRLVAGPELLGAGQALCVDPDGVLVGLCESPDAAPRAVPGAVAYAELVSSSPALQFYRELLGAKPRVVEAADGEASHWRVSFQVADVDAAVQLVVASGGHVLAPAGDSAHGRVAQLSDADGAAFGLVQP